MNFNNQSFVNHQERICKLYGICGKNTRCLESHQVSQFGLNRLKKGKSRER